MKKNNNALIVILLICSAVVFCVNAYNNIKHKTARDFYKNIAVREVVMTKDTAYVASTEKFIKSNNISKAYMQNGLRVIYVVSFNDSSAMRLAHEGRFVDPKIMKIIENFKK